MPTYFFHQHLNGKTLALDDTGIVLSDHDEAVKTAFDLISKLMAEISPDSVDAALQEHRGNGTHLSIEISDGANILSIIRGKVYVETVTRRPTNTFKTLPP